MPDLPVDQLTRVRSQEREQQWPDSIKLVATRGKRKREIEITKEQFFGIGSSGAPINGDQLIHMIHTLRRLCTPTTTCPKTLVPAQEGAAHE